MRTQAWRSVCPVVAAISATLLVTLPFGLSADPPNEPAADSPTARIRAALDLEIDCEFVQNSLSDVAVHLAHALGIDVVLDRKGLEEIGIATNAPEITKKLTGISTRSALRLMLNDLDLTYVIRDQALWITPIEKAESQPVARVYRVGDIVNIEGIDEHGPNYHDLADTIVHIVAPDTWYEVGGSGSIDAIYGALVVSQTDSVHEKIEAFLEAYRLIIQTDQLPEEAGLQAIILGQEKHRPLHDSLDKPVTVLLRDKPLWKAMESIGDKLQVPIMLDIRSLEEYGIDSATPVSGKFAEVPMRFVLKRLLHELDLTYMIRDEVILVTTPEACESQLLDGLYSVRDLVQLHSADPKSDDLDFDSLIQVITTTIEPDSWDVVGGPGGIDSLLPAPTLVISQTQDVHEQISKLLGRLQAAKRHEETRQEKVLDPDKITLRAYHLFSGGVVDPAAVIKIILRDTDDEIWSDQKKTFIEPLGQAIVLKHNAPAHARIRELLKELGVWHPPHQHDGKNSMGRGMSGGMF